MRRQNDRWTACWLLAVIVLVGVGAPAAADDDEIPFEEAQLFFELNDTDGDLGIHGKVDGGPWKQVIIETPDEDRIFALRVYDELRDQGMTELFFESEEPPFDELPPEEFFERFPAGIYEWEGRTLDGEELEGEVEVSHVMPAPPGNITVGGQAAAEDCDAELPIVSAPVVIAWDPVTTSHPDLGEEGDVEVDVYEVHVEGDEASLTVELPAYITELEVPEAILDLGEEFKFEILVIADSGNKTAIESCFLVE